MQKLAAGAQRRDGRASTLSSSRSRASRSTRRGFCAKTGGLLAAESAMLAYMEKNKDWCSIPDDAIDQSQGRPRQERRLQRQGLHRRRADQEDEGAGRAGRRPAAAAGAAASGRPALSAAPRAPVLPDARPASLVLRLTPDFALPFVQLARLDRPDRLAAAARALLAGRRRSPALAAASRAEPLASRALPRRRDRDARRGLHLQRHPRPQARRRASSAPAAVRCPRAGSSVDGGGGVHGRAVARRPRRAPAVQRVLDRARDRLARRSSRSIR